MLEAAKSAGIVDEVNCVKPEEFKKESCGRRREILEGKEDVLITLEGAGRNRCR